MSEPRNTAEAPSAPPIGRDRSPAARRAARVKKAEREQRIVALLNRGVSVAEIARREGVTLFHMRNQVRAILARRAPQAPAEYLALQVNRLNEALMLSYGAMYNDEQGTNLGAVDRVVKIVREMDRYHGFAAPAGPRAEPAPTLLPAAAAPPLALAAPAAERIDNGAATA
jgi:DNA-binding CsgD family transcriptional regulator